MLLLYIIQVCTCSIEFLYYITCILYYSTFQSLSCEEHLLSLPDELLLMILSNLDQRDLFKCMLVCRRLLHIASDATLCKCLSIPKHAECRVWQLMNLIGKCILLQKCSGVCDEHLMWMRKKTPARVVLHNCKGTLSASVIQQFFRSGANTLKVSLSSLLFNL